MRPSGDPEALRLNEGSLELGLAARCPHPQILAVGAGREQAWTPTFWPPSHPGPLSLWPSLVRAGPLSPSYAALSAGLRLSDLLCWKVLIESNSYPLFAHYSL